ncbi:hypothetical protein M3Y95_01162600 [Aphelenchoides besseyi]|nr:hypothetical protein M3Y95_01162600 [Aphelenchoides besseyi]
MGPEGGRNAFYMAGDEEFDKNSPFRVSGLLSYQKCKKKEQKVAHSVSFDSSTMGKTNNKATNWILLFISTVWSKLSVNQP